MQMYGGADVLLHVFLTSARGGDDRWAVYSGAEKQMRAPAGNRTPVIQPVASHCTDRVTSNRL
jgi:hypothetical protein